VHAISRSMKETTVKKIMRSNKLKLVGRLKRISSWIGQQNVFLVILIVFLLLFGLHKTYGVINAVFTKDSKAGSNEQLESRNKRNINDNVVETWKDARPVISPSPSISPKPSISPSPIPLPTIDPDPIIECTMAINCGGNIVKMRKSECTNSVCCPVEPNKYESLPEQECNSRQFEYNKKQNEEYRKQLQAYEKYLDEFYAAKAQDSLDIQKLDALKKSNEVYEEQRLNSYNACVSSVKQKSISLCSINGTCDSTGYGSPSWYVSQETLKCKQVYGY